MLSNFDPFCLNYKIYIKIMKKLYKNYDMWMRVCVCICVCVCVCENCLWLYILYKQCHMKNTTTYLKCLVNFCQKDKVNLSNFFQ